MGSLSWSPDDSQLVAATGEPVNGEQHQPAIRIWKLSDNSDRALPTEDIGAAWQVSWSPDGNSIIAGANDGTMHLWEVRRNRWRSVRQESKAPVWSVIWSPDGKQFAAAFGDVTGSADKDHAVRIWNADRRLSKAFAGLPAPVLGISWAADGSQIAGVTLNGTIYIWAVGS